MDLPIGFRFAGVTCGIKKSGKADMTLVVADANSVAAGVYTLNQVVAAPVVLCRTRTPGPVRAIVINSGNANACTGDKGMENAIRTCQAVADAISCEPEQVVVMSTGIIGHHLPMEKILHGVQLANSSLEPGEAAFLRASDAILTTDNGRKVTSRQVEIAPGCMATLAGMAKGAGMIGPNMATMLGVVVTDFPLTPDAAQAALQKAADLSFNRISVEGHTSTNDSLVLLSSNQAGANTPITDEAKTRFQTALEAMCIQLAKQIPADGEGATHVIEITVQGAENDHSAANIARTIADSPLVKTAITGGDPNWGRIVSAAGYAGEPITPPEMALTIQGMQVYAEGAPVSFDARAASLAIKAEKDVRLVLTVGKGVGKATYWTSDLTCDYVRFNSEYST